MNKKIIALAILAAFASAALQGCSSAEERHAQALERGQQFLDEGNYAKARIEFSNALQIQPSDATARYLSAVAAEKSGDLRAAMQGYQATLTVEDTHPLALAALARMHVFSGLTDEAFAMIKKGLASHPDHIELIAIRAAAEIAAGNEAEAFADTSAVLAKNPDHEYAVALAAGIHRNRGESDQAIALLSGVLQRAPDSVDLRLVLAQLYIDAHDNERAEQELKQIVVSRPLELQHRQRLVAFYTSTGRPELAESSLRELVGLDAKSLESKFALINHLAAQRSFDVAERELLGFVAAQPKDFPLRLATGQFYEAHNLAPEAEKIYKEVITEDGTGPSGLGARNRLATLAIRSNRVGDARPLIDQVLAANPGDNDALVLRATLAMAENRALDAITDLRAVQRDQPDSAPIMHTLARAHIQNNESELAREQYRRAIQVDPANVTIRNEYADFLIRGGDVAEARPLLDSVLAADPQNLVALELQYRALSAVNDVPGANEVAQKIMTEYPDSPLGYFFAGVILEARGELAAAKTSYERSLEKAPRGAEPLGALVRVAIRMGDKGDASKFLEDVIAKYPDNAVALNLYSEIKLSDRALDDAEKLATSASAAAVGWWLPYRTRALVLLAKGAADGAIGSYEDGMAATGDSPALGMELAALHERVGQADKAIAVYERMLANNPASQALANNLAMLLTNYREDGESRDKAHELVRVLRGSDNPAYLNTYGWVRYNQGQVDEAVTYLRRASTAVPGDPLMHYHLGMALLASGDSEQARAELERALESQQPFPGRDAAQKALQSLPQKPG